MAKFLIAFGRKETPLSQNDLRRAFQPECAALGIKKPDTHVCGHVSTAMLGGDELVGHEDRAFCFGILLRDQKEWAKVGSNTPEGAYALVRYDDETIELVTDMVASRAIWYAVTDDKFIVSTSQFAVIRSLPDLQFDQTTLAWYLAAGTLGPYRSWDARVQMLKPDSVLRFDRHAWRHTVQTGNVEFCEARSSEAATTKDLEGTIDASFSQVRLDEKSWHISLSGGYDSRLNLLKIGPTKLQCFSHGRRDALSDPVGDAAVAKSIAIAVGAKFEFLPFDLSDYSPSVLLTSLLHASDGRVSNFTGVLDNLDSFRKLSAEGVRGIVRGDECFGWLETTTEEDVRRGVGLALLSDFYAPAQIAEWGLTCPELPVEWQRRPAESRENWRDRLYQGYRLPLVLAPLSDIVLNFMEVANPLLTHPIIRMVRRLPPNLRTAKKSIKHISLKLKPRIPYATNGSLPPYSEYWSQGFLIELAAALSNPAAKKVFNNSFIEHVLTLIPLHAAERTNSRRRWGKLASRFLPKSLRSVLRLTVARPKLGRELALNAYMALRVYELLTAEPVAGASHSSSFSAAAS
ncbi:hypothetical protein [Mesorhizobium sp. M0968]|uniref:hypothetical protein n=1 Tax=Mesorhizobium sp. M0968 TaxID=2957037 RepID=UPI00333D9471